MRAKGTALALGLLFIALPVHAANTHAYTGDDPTGDATGSPIDAGAPDYADLLSADVALGQDTLYWNITVVGLDNREPTGFLAPEYWVEFQFRNTLFHATLVPRNAGTQESLTATALYRQDDGEWNLLFEGEGLVDGNTLRYETPIENVLTADGIYPLPGNVITATSATVIADTNSGTYHDGTDYSNGQTWADAIEFPAGLDLVVPGVSHDGLILTIPNPVRFSNGEATTFQWLVEALNPTTDFMEGVIDAESTNDAFILNHPATISLGPGEARTFSLFATTPFAHSHGSLEEIHLRIDGSNIDGEATVAIQYPAIPQPAGHHNRLYLHGEAIGTTLPGTGARWMNTAQEDPAATASRIGNGLGSCVVDGTETVGIGWWFPLQPLLRIGLDARIQETGTLEFDLGTDGTILGGTLYGRLHLVDHSVSRFAFNAETSRLEVDDSTFAIDIPQMLPGSVIDVEAEVPMPAELDLVPPQLEKTLGLLMVYCDDQSLATGATATNVLSQVPGDEHFIAGDPTMTLPLNEYHDAVDVLPIAGAIDLTGTEPMIEAAPGAAVLFDVLAKSSGEGAEYSLRIFGAHSDAAELLTPNRISPSSDGEAIHVAFTVPETGVRGDAFEIILEAVNPDDPLDADAMRLVVTVNPSSERDDSAAIANLQSSDDEDTPALGIAFIVGLLVFACRRRR